jgi:membrane protein DedA with SNARE-associated domain
MHYTALIDQYGYIVLFVALMLELIIFGIPTEILMGYAGFLVYEGKLNWILAILSAGLGTSIGISLSYFIGQRLGFPFFKKHGHKIHMGPDRFDKFSVWFSKFGNGLIVVAYFIPGVRHITGYFSGITSLKFRRFAPFAYLGAFIWVSAFISLGKVLGPHWGTFHNVIKKYLIFGCVCLGIFLVLFFLYRRLKGNLIENLKGIATRYPLRAKVSIIGTTLICLTLFALFIGLTQDYF